jgi:hypothetical protein
MKARKAMQIALRGVNEAGAGVLQALLSAHGVDIIGWRTFDSTGDTRLAVELQDAARAESILRETDMKPEMTPVVVARLFEPQAKYQLLMELAYAGIKVAYFYSLAPLDRPTLAVFKTDEDDRALQVIQASPWEFRETEEGGGEPDGAAGLSCGCERGLAT